MLRKIFITIVFGSSITLSNAQIQWPAITQQTKPWARWWWEGSAVNKKDLTANMQDYKAAGLGGLEITPIYGVYGYEKEFINFLSPQWMQMLDHTLKEGKRLDIGIDIANGTGWPFGGPTITDKEASKTIYSKWYTIRGGEELQVPVIYKVEPMVRTANNKQVSIDQVNPLISKNNNLQELALDQVKFPVSLSPFLVMAFSDKGTKTDKIDMNDNSTAINLTDKVDANGKLNWKAPDDNWVVYALFQGLHGKMVERAAPGGEGYAIDHFSADALRHYFKRFDAAFKGHDISGIRALFNDSYEVDDARGQSNWTPAFFSEFQKRRGYDLKNFLPALFNNGINRDLNSRVIYDYRTTIGELILEDFTREWKKWGTTKGAIIRNQSHGSPANLLDLYGAIDIPETEGDDILRYKFATSVSHVMGKPLASSESATWLNEHFLSSWGDVKKALDLYLLGGVNHIFYHGVNYSPREEQWPGWLFYAAVHFQQTNPQWKDFHKLNEYVARVQSFLQRGKPDNDVLIYYPLADRYSDPGNALLQHFDGMGREFAGTDFEKVSTWLQQNGYSFDFFSDKQLMNFTNEGNGISTGGNRYQTILLPGNKYIPETSFQKIYDLATNGATILIYNGFPSDVPGFGNLSERRSKFKQLMSGFQTNVAFQFAKVGKGVFIGGGDQIQNMMIAAGIRKESLTENGLQFIRRKNPDGQTYFINNRSNKEVNDWITLNVTALSVGLFDAMAIKSGLANWRKKDNGIEVMIQLKPFESVIVQTYNSKKEGNNFPYIQTIAKPQPIKGHWILSFINGGPSIPATVKINELGSWTLIEGDAYKNFSGTAKYTISFAKPSEMPAAWLLDLGKVNETAEVILNGKRIATLIGPYFQVVIPAADVKQTNTLEIIVSNLMANRIAYMDKNNIPWKKFYNTNMPARKRENAKNGIFDASAWTPLPSGLTGPVTITPVSYNIK